MSTILRDLFSIALICIFSNSSAFLIRSYIGRRSGEGLQSQTTPNNPIILFASPGRSSPNKSPTKTNDHNDKDMLKAFKALEKIEQKKASKTTRKLEKNASKKDTSNKEKNVLKNEIEGDNFAKKAITGKNIITCREFHIDSPKAFEFIGSYQDSVAPPIYGIPEIGIFA
jgi:hypothetical protein